MGAGCLRAAGTIMSGQKSPATTDRMGLYDRLTDVPAHHRLGRYADRYADRDVWATFTASRPVAHDSAEYAATLRKTARTWRPHARERGRHPALARPRDVEAWCRDLASSRVIGTVYSEYWVRLEEFYGWLLTHTDHPHVYHPVLMAAAQFETAGRIWADKIGRANKAVPDRD